MPFLNERGVGALGITLLLTKEDGDDLNNTVAAIGTIIDHAVQMYVGEVPEAALALADCLARRLKLYEQAAQDQNKNGELTTFTTKLAAERSSQN